jgi:hypothetical protein
VALSSTSDSSRLAAEAGRAASALLAQAASQDWRGPDPYDGLYFRWPAWLTGGRRRRQAIVQAHARAPVDIRHLYRRTHPRIAKALGMFGSVGVRMGRAGDLEASRLGLIALGLLEADRTAGTGWGYPFDVQTRWSFYPAGSPNVVVTSFVVQGLLEGAKATDQPHLRTRAVAAARWVLDELWVQGGGYFRYHPTADVNIHNANLLGALCVHLGTGDEPLARERIRQAVDRTLSAQAADGGFPYGEGARLMWRDSFHTGFVLRCLMEMDSIDPAVGDAVRRGAEAYLRFFDSHGRAKLWADREYPEDAHSAGTGLSTLALLCRRGVVDPEVLSRVTTRTITAGLRDGHAAARRYRWGATTVHYLRWCDAHVALGLADAAAALSARPNRYPLRETRTPHPFSTPAQPY